MQVFIIYKKYSVKLLTKTEQFRGLLLFRMSRIIAQKKRGWFELKKFLNFDKLQKYLMHFNIPGHCKTQEVFKTRM